MLRLPLKRSLRSFQPTPTLAKRTIVGGSNRIPSNDSKTPCQQGSQVYPEQIQQLQTACDYLDRSIFEEVKKLEHKIEVSKTDNSWENRQLATELNDADQKHTERTDALARDIQLHKADFHRAFEGLKKDVQQQVGSLHQRFDALQVTNHSSIRSAWEESKATKKSDIPDKTDDKSKVAAKENATEKGEAAVAVFFGILIFSLHLCLFSIICENFKWKPFEFFRTQSPIKRDRFHNTIGLRSPIWYDFAEEELQERSRILEQKKRAREIRDLEETYLEDDEEYDEEDDEEDDE